MKIQGEEIPVDLLGHGQKFKIIRRKRRITYRTVSIEVAKLYLDWLHYWRLEQLHDACCPRTSRDMSTCPERIRLSKELDAIHARAERILPTSRNLGGATSPAWWEKLGFRVTHNDIIIP